jgi:molecular chaperone GrpE
MFSKNRTDGRKVKKPEDGKHNRPSPNGEAISEIGPDRAAPGGGEDVPTDDAADAGPTVDQLSTELGDARGELDRATDQFRRLAADFDNYKKRVERERMEVTTRAQADVVRRLLEVVDDLERVAAFAEDTPAPLLEGIQLVERKLFQVLSSLGLERIDAHGAIFDPTTMEGLATVPAASPEEDDTVADVFQNGYLFKGQVLRPARVRVKQHEA